jgi:CRP/FNR family cyclic AMP-dependent transcriptional regulator
MGVPIDIFRRSQQQIPFEAGALIFAQGDPGDQMYVITSGQVDIAVDGELIAVLGPGELLGEMALIDSGPRSASATARSRCTLTAIDRARFMFLVQETPYFALQVMQSLAERLRQERRRGAAMREVTR